MDDVVQITIVGTGLMGASCGLGLRAAGYPGRIVGVSRRLETAERARQLGCIDTATDDLGPALGDSQLVVVAVPLGAYEPVLSQVARHDHGQLTITDVGSTKQQVCAHARRLLPDPTRFVGCHPMAGAEQHGPDAARADLFVGKPCIITAEADTQGNAQRVVEGLWTTLQMRLIHLTPQQHDQQVALVSHLPHALAVLLFQLAARQGQLELASTGLRDTTRLASGDPQIWLDIFATNRQAVVEAIDAFDRQLADFRRMLAAEQDPALLELLCQNKQARDRWIEQGSR